MSDSSRPLRLSLGGAAALAAAMGVGRFAYTPILPAMTAALGLSKTQAGLLASANLLGYLAGALAASLPRLRGCSRTWLLASLGASTLSTLLMAGADGFAGLLVLRLVGGLASAFVLVLASTVILDELTALRRPDLASVPFAGVGVGIVVSSLLITALTVLGSDWRGLWLSVGIASGLATLALATLVPRAPPRAAAPAMRRPLSIDRRLVALAGAYLLFGIGNVAIATFLVATVRTTPGLGTIEPVVWIVVGLAACPSAAIWGRVGRRIGTVQAFGAALLLEGLGAGGLVVGGAAGALMAAALLGVTFVGITALGLVAARALGCGDPRRIAALMTSAFGVGSIVAPSAAGLMADLTGSFALPTVLAGGALVLAALLSLGSLPPPVRQTRSGAVSA